MFNRLLALFLLVILSPLFLIVALAILIEDGFPVFFTQSRIGINYSYFYIYKFRSMKKDTPNVATHLITNPEKYLLKIGKFLRKTKLNELPQLLNVLVGDMSVVGPRPLTAETRRYIPKMSLRKIASLKPGITGIGSIIFRNEEWVIRPLPYPFETRL